MVYKGSFLVECQLLKTIFFDLVVYKVLYLARKGGNSSREREC